VLLTLAFYNYGQLEEEEVEEDEEEYEVWVVEEEEEEKAFRMVQLPLLFLP
jgi:hypothetical protein